jgi:uncharacterized membrane protein
MNFASLLAALILASASLIFSVVFVFLYAKRLKSFKPDESGELPKEEISLLFAGSLPLFILSIVSIVLMDQVSMAESQKTLFVTLLIALLFIGAIIGFLFSSFAIEKQFKRKGVMIVGKQSGYFMLPTILFFVGVLFSLLAFCFSIILLVS